MRDVKFWKLGFIWILELSIIVLALASFASGLHVSGTYNGEVGFSEDLAASIDQSIAETTLMGETGISKTIVGNADLSESHFVSNMDGDYAEVGATILGAVSNYVYTYELFPGPGANKLSDHVWATENLNVPDATYIKAYANSRNRNGLISGVSTEVAQVGATKASLMGYSNMAFASADSAKGSQSFGSASGQINTITESSTLGLPIKGKGKAVDQVAKAVLDARITTTATGSISGYSDSAVNQAGSVELAQDGHVTGSFTSTASATGAPDKTRTSNYGTDYDLHMRATKYLSGSATSGILSYYINPGMATPTLGAIQGGVNAAESGDTINMAAGTYNENVDISKSLQLIGAGMAATIVDGGGRTDSVFDIAPAATVNLAQMTIQNGQGKSGGKYGGGIYNAGSLVLDQVKVTNNQANSPYGRGGGIYNSGDLTLINSLITNNQAKPTNFRYSAGGGGIFNSGTVNMDQGTSITGNTANYGGGIYNLGTVAKTAIVNMNAGSSIAGNTATGSNGGGGIYNEFNGVVNMNAGSSIAGNKALSSGYRYGGGGIYNGYGCTVNMNGGSITGNEARDGGGISNVGTVNMNPGSSITGNKATNNGGGIYNFYHGGNSGTVNMNAGSSIASNTALNGGGVYNDYLSTLNLNGGVIGGLDSSFANKATNGGGIYNKGTVNLNSGSVWFNQATAVGGGIRNEYGTITGDTGLVLSNTPDNIYP